MACDGVGDRTDADFVFVGDTAARPSWLVKISQERQRRAANGDIVFNQFRQRTIGEGCVADVVVLFESFNRGAIATADPQGAIGEDAFGIADVPENFLG